MGDASPLGTGRVCVVTVAKKGEPGVADYVENYYYNLGTYHRPVSAASPEAQRWFDRGLIWCYGFNHEEALKCFKRVTEIDPDCAMAYWGIAYACGPNYNKPWEAFSDTDLTQSLEQAYAATQMALARLNGASATEQALIRTLTHRYPSSTPVEDCHIWNDAYASAMREVYRAFPDDLDVCSLFAEAMMNRTAWALWNLKTGEPAEGADTAEAMEVLEKAMSRMQQAGDERHPGLLHMYIHLMEMSPHPERALRAADALRDVVPDAGHLQHMPTHIDVLCGDYQTVVTSNTRAIAADRKYLDREGPLNFYSLYRCHNYHFKLYGAMFLGQYQTALEAANGIVATLPEALLQVEVPPMADWLEGFVPMVQHVWIRFGKWQEIIAQPLPQNPALFCVTTAMIHYAKAIAYATTGDLSAAETERQRFESAVPHVPGTRYVFNNTCLDILAVAAEMMYGELEYRKGNFEAAFAHLRKSVELDDNLPYDEPWAWMQPTRHALGALLLEQGRVEEAEAVYRADLGLDDTLSRACQHPDNVWSLHGFHECLLRLNKTDEARMVKLRLELATARADVPIESSCYCRLTHAA
jgi:tetratricopeptide (TPR) repeat protein